MFRSPWIKLISGFQFGLHHLKIVEPVATFTGGNPGIPGTGQIRFGISAFLSIAPDSHGTAELGVPELHFQFVHFFRFELCVQPCGFVP